MALYDDTFVYVRANLAWAGIGLPLYFLVFLALLLFADLVDQPADPQTLLVWPLLLTAACMLLIPSPGTAGLARMAAISAAGDSPTWEAFSRGFGKHWRLGAGLWVAGVVGSFVLSVNVAFYFAADGWLKLVGVPWAYALVYWLALQTYLAPLLVHLNRPRLLDLYRRAALLTLAHPLLTILLTLTTVTVGLLGTVFLPVGLLLAGAYVSLVQAHALRSVRIRLGDLTIERSGEMEDFPSR